MSAELLTALGSKVCALRKARGVSQEDFAREAGIDRAYMGKIERGLQNISVVTAAKIAAALDVTISELLEGVDGSGTTSE